MLSEPTAPTRAQMHTIETAARAARSIRRARAVAITSGSTTLFFAFISLIIALFSPWAFLGVVVMVAVGVTELRASARLARFDTRAPRLLASNQLAFCAAICLYASWQIVREMLGPGAYAEQIEANPEVADMLGPIDQTMTLITVAVYAVLIPASVLFQGGLALYYATRGAHLRRFLSDTPQWACDVHRMAA